MNWAPSPMSYGGLRTVSPPGSVNLATGGIGTSPIPSYDPLRNTGAPIYPSDVIASSRAAAAAQLGGLSAPSPQINFHFNTGDQGGTSTGDQNSTDFGTLRNTKSGAVQSALDALLGKTSQLSDFSQNPFVVRSNVKSQEQADRITGAANQVASDKVSNRANLSDFITKYMAAGPGETANTGQETSAIGEYYDKGPGGVQANLDRQSMAQHIADVAVAAHAAGQARALNNGLRQTTGDNSYADRQLMDTISGIRLTEAQKKAERDRANYLTVKDAQTKLAGQRNALTDATLSRGLVPINATTSLTNSELAQTGQLGNLDQANTIYQIDSPEAQLARRLGLVRDASQIDLANNFYGLRKPYDPNVSGIVPSLRRGGGVNYSNPGAPPADYGSYSGLPPASGLRAPGPRSLAEEMYKRQSGVYPTEDPNFSPALLNWARNASAPQYQKNTPDGWPSDQTYAGQLNGLGDVNFGGGAEYVG